MLLILLVFALASSGLAQAQLPSNQWNQVRGGFARELKASSVNSNIRWIAGAGPYIAVLSDDSAKMTTLSVLKNSKTVFSIKDGDSRLRGTLYGNRKITMQGDWTGQKLIFPSWCGAITTPTGVIKEICQILELDITNARIRELVYKGQTISTTFNGRKTADWSITRMSMASVAETGAFLTMDLAKASTCLTGPCNLVTNGLFRIESTGITQLISATETPGHSQVSVDNSNVATSPDGKKVFYEETFAPNGSNLRLYDLDTKSSSVVLTPGQSVGDYRLALYYDVQQDFYGKSVYARSGVINAVVQVFPNLQLLFAPGQKYEEVPTSSNALFWSNGLSAFTAKSTGAAYTSLIQGKSVLATSQDKVDGRTIDSFGTIGVSGCQIVAPALDEQTFARFLIDFRPILISRLTASPDGQTARMGGCGLSLEGLPLDSVTIGGATAEVVGRETDANGQDVLVLRPLSPVYAGMTEVAVTINGKRFASMVNATGPSAPSISVVNGASFEQKLSPQTIAILRSSGSTGTTAAAGPNAAFLLGGANIRVCDFPARLLYNSGSSINFLIPKDVAGKESCEVVLSVNSKESSRATIKLERVTPAIFGFYPNKLESGEIDTSLLLPIVTFVDESGVQHYVGPENTSFETLAAPENQVVSIWLTGAGPTFPEVPDGNNTPPDGFYRCVDEGGKTENPDGTPVAPVVKIGGVAAEVSFCGLVPNSTGLYLINARIPLGTVPGENYLWIGEDKDGNPLSPVYKLWTK